MVQDMSNPFFSAMERNAKQAAAQIGATLNVQDAQVDLANQNTQIDAFMQLSTMSPGSSRYQRAKRRGD
jgi:ribose transport system substrate-binding protein